MNGRAVLVGNARMLADAGIAADEFGPVAATLAAEAKTPVLAAVDGALAGVLAVADPVKDDSAAAITALHRLGAEVVMLTGDNATTAAAIARRVGVRRVVAEVLPEHKAGEIQRLQAEGRTVGMVGDGINDAPALAAADVGLAIGTGTDVAIEAADITLISGSLAGVAIAISLSTATMRNIRQNLFFALAYNGIGIPVAAGVLYPFFGIRLPPIIAAAAMALSSLSVVGNANRLRRYRPPPLPEADMASIEPHMQVGGAHDAAARAQDGGGRGRGAPEHHSIRHSHARGGTDDAAPGVTVTDPVCGMQVNPETAAQHRDTSTGTMFFCSASCATAFDSEPQRYATSAAGTEPAALSTDLPEFLAVRTVVDPTSRPARSSRSAVTCWSWRMRRAVLACAACRHSLALEGPRPQVGTLVAPDPGQCPYPGRVPSAKLHVDSPCTSCRRVRWMS